MDSNKGITLTELIITVIIIGVLASVGIPAYQDYIADKNGAAHKVEQNDINPIHEEAKDIPVVKKPPSGVYTKNLNGKQAIAPLEIRTESGADYYVKVVDLTSNIDTLTIFIHGGDTVDVEVPLGSYEIRYASGNHWYGDENLFGSDTSFNKADNIFEFTDSGYQVSGYTITLYQVVNGNLQTKKIGKDQF